MPQPMRGQPLGPALDFEPRVSLTTVWDFCHLLAQHEWTLHGLAARYDRTIGAMEKIFDRSWRVLRAAGIEIQSFVIQRGPDAQEFESTTYCVRDRLWQTKLERLRVKARMATRRAKRRA